MYHAPLIEVPVVPQKYGKRFYTFNSWINGGNSTVPQPYPGLLVVFPSQLKCESKVVCQNKKITNYKPQRISLLCYREWFRKTDYPYFQRDADQ